MDITREKLEELGFDDQTGGWGGSQGMDWVYKKSNPKIEIRTVDYDSKWHLSDDFKISFSTIEELDSYCQNKYGLRLGK